LKRAEDLIKKARGAVMDESALLQEYYEIHKTVKEFDKNLLTVKGWGVTLTLAALAWGFKDGHFGLFLVASLSGLSFWLVEGTMKRHQMRFYLRMREIEVIRYHQAKDEKAKEASSPRIDSSWSRAGSFYKGRCSKNYCPAVFEGPRKFYRWAWIFPHVAFPHIVGVAAGVVLFFLGFYGMLGELHW
jgi:hypothetical protein